MVTYSGACIVLFVELSYNCSFLKLDDYYLARLLPASHQPSMAITDRVDFQKET